MLDMRQVRHSESCRLEIHLKGNQLIWPEQASSFSFLLLNHRFNFFFSLCYNCRVENQAFSICNEWEWGIEGPNVEH